mmetsp:Transcript_11273/g.26350  ORF Transcript_11273/g.26350 Transcript_11273/m.26350 type:complete len:283 (+) Transcript_11273:224-1072(+)
MSSPPSILFVWDFDWTVVNCNSDEYVPARFLGDDELRTRLSSLIQARGTSAWHDCVAQVINEANASRRELLEAAAEMPYLEDVLGSLTDVHGSGKCGQAIISDGNDEFIGAFVERNGIGRCFTHGIETNFGRWESAADGRDVFSVVHQSTKYGGHDNEHCPPNLCKTQVLERDILGKLEERPRIVYVGDGGNDACPALNVLQEGDVLLAREGRRGTRANSKRGMLTDAENAEKCEKEAEFAIMRSLAKREGKEGKKRRCLVKTWNEGKELRTLVRNILNDHF